MASESEYVKTWDKRRRAAVDIREKWEKAFRVEDCYKYWKGEQLAAPLDEYGDRKVIINKIHADVKNQIPALYFYTPFIRVTAAPELADTPGSEIDESMQLLQDTANHLIRLDTTSFKNSTHMALKEAFWSFGCVEVGYTSDPMDDPSAERPPLKEQKDTKVQKPKAVEEMSDDEVSMALMEEKGSIKAERFFVRHIPSKQVLVSISDKPILEENDWIGYWDDVPVEDVKKAGKRGYYKNTEDLKASSMTAEGEEMKRLYERDEECGNMQRVRLYKVWDLRTREKLVWAHGNEKFLLRKRFKRCPLKFLRFDIDPYHFLPRPPIFSQLSPQEEYNHSRDYLRKVRNATVPRYTVDEDAVLDSEMAKLERNEVGTWIKRRGGTIDPIQPIGQPSHSENSLQTLSLSDKEFFDVSGSSGDARLAQTKTATQAKIAEVKGQAQDNFDRIILSEFLASVGKELLMLAIDHMTIDQVIAINVAPDSMYAPMEAQSVQQSYMVLKAMELNAAANSVGWDLSVDIESLSPVSEEEKFQKWMQGLQFIGNPGMAMVFAFSPELLKHTLKLMGLRSAREQELILSTMQSMVQMQQQQMAMQAQAGGSPPATPGISPMGGGAQPGQPQPAGPGASTPKPS